ncbi:hypothetical protein HUU05_14350 [candidate division KSB1 bacterium]|nr:hypothetical protein [candidate division KSB1 bacterium]
MPRILWLCALVCLLHSEQNTLQAQETWQIQHIIDNDDYVMGVQQSSRDANAPRDNRGLALSPDRQFLYLGYNNPPDRRLVRKISLRVKDPANNSLAVVAQLAFSNGDAPAKAIATDDKGRVYLARGRRVEIYDANLSERLFALADFEKCEGIAAARLEGKLVLYATDRARGTLSRFELSEGEGLELRHARKAGLSGEGEIVIANHKSLRGLAVQSDGTAWLADHDPGRVFRIYPNGRMNSISVRNAIDVALDEKRGEIFVTQDTSRTITVLRLTDGAFVRTLTPPLAELKLAERGANLALTGVEVIPGQGLFVCNENGRSLTTGAAGDSPFSNSDDSEFFFGDDNDPVLVMNFTFAADAGPDREIMLGQAVTLGGNPTVLGGRPPHRYRWAPLEGLNDNTLSNPIAKPNRTTTYSVIVTDKAGAVAQDRVTITVPNFVFLARAFVFFGGNENSVGNIYSNGPITFETGLPGMHRGNLTAAGDIILYEQNLIIGAVKAGGRLILRPGARVDGTTQERAEIPEMPLPQFSFQTGGANISVTEDMALLPGSYGKVRIAPQAALHLQNGEYYFERLAAQAGSRIIFENAAAPTWINVTAGMNVGDNVKVQLAQTEGASTTQVHFRVLQKGNLEIGKGAVLLGNLVAPAAHVYLASGARLLGSVTAEAITVAKNVMVHSHPAGPQEMLELTPIYLTHGAAPSKAQGPVRRFSSRRDTVIAPDPVPVDTVVEAAELVDTTQTVVTPDTLIIPMPSTKPGNKLVPVLVGLILLALLLLLLFLLLRRKRTMQPPDYWQVKQTRRTPENPGPHHEQKQDGNRHWRIRSRR